MIIDLDYEGEDIYTVRGANRVLLDIYESGSVTDKVFGSASKLLETLNRNTPPSLVLREIKPYNMGIRVKFTVVETEKKLVLDILSGPRYNVSVQDGEVNGPTLNDRNSQKIFSFILQELS